MWVGKEKRDEKIKPEFFVWFKLFFVDLLIVLCHIHVYIAD